MKIIFNCRDIVLLHNGKYFAVCSGFQGKDPDGKIIGSNVRYVRNPIEAFDYWIMLVDAAGRRSIGKYLTGLGRDPYTGELDTVQVQNRLQSIRKDR